MSKSDPNIKL